MASALSIVAAVAVAGAYAGGPVKDPGAIAGKVALAGTPPKPQSYRITKDNVACGESKLTEDVVVGADRGLKNVVVALEGIARGKPVGELGEIGVDQRACVFIPRVQAAVVGTRVNLWNNDAVLHNIHAYLGKATVFNLGMPLKGQKIPQTLARPGLLDLKCDAGHTWMRAFIHVFEHPYFAVTGDDGAYRLDQVPAGKVKLTVWHERYGTLTREVEVAAGGEARLDLEFKAR